MTTTNALGVRIEFLDGTDNDTVQAVLGSLLTNGWTVELHMADGSELVGAFEGTFTLPDYSLMVRFRVWDEEDFCLGSTVAEVPFDDIATIGIL